MASWYDHIEIAEYLVDKGANLEAKDDVGNTPLDIARFSKNTELIEYFTSKGAKHKRRSVESQSNVFLPAKETDSASSAASQISSWLSDFSELFRSIPQRVFSSANVALVEQETINSTHMPRDEVKIGKVSVGATLLLCDLITRKITGKRHNTFFKGSELLNSESADRIMQAIYKFPSTLESRAVTKEFNSTFKC